MIPRIRLLNRMLANQIAAGEVVERPASVVKELLENSLDAKASNIEVTIQQGGFHIIKVRDDGCGIEQQDMRLAVSRHATSKISNIHDLAAIDTLGFRGEALASIAAVSRFWMSSKPEHQMQAWQIHMDGSDTEMELQPTAHPTGTTVMVQDLFFNTPARRKFLRSERTEYLQIEELFKRMALSQLNIGFSLTHNQRMLYRLLPATTPIQQQRRIAKIFGKSFLENACEVDIHATGLNLTGWLALPNLSRSQNDLQYIYLNGRLVRDRVINHALRQAYDDLLPAGRQALYVLYFTIDPALVDVNVHPAKYEVRFHQARLVHDFLVSAVRKSLQRAQVPIAQSTLDYSEETEGVENSINNMFMHSRPLSYVAEPTPTYITVNDAVTIEPVQNTQEIEKVVIAAASEELTLPLAENVVATWGKAIACLQDRWLLSEITSGILLIESHAAQRFLSEQRLMHAYAQTEFNSQPLLFPHTHVLTESLLIQLLEQREKFQQIGITIDQLAPNTVAVRTLPTLLLELDSYAFLLALSARLQQLPVLEIKEIVKLASQYLKPSSLNTTLQQQSLLQELDRHLPLKLTALPAFCNELTYQELTKRFIAVS